MGIDIVVRLRGRTKCGADVLSCTNGVAVAAAHMFFGLVRGGSRAVAVDGLPGTPGAPGARDEKN